MLDAADLSTTLLGHLERFADIPLKPQKKMLPNHIFALLDKEDTHILYHWDCKQLSCDFSISIGYYYFARYNCAH